MYQYSIEGEAGVKNQDDLRMGFSVRLKLLIQLKTVMTTEQLTKLDHAVENGELKTTRFTPEEFRDLVNKLVAYRLAKRMRRLNDK